MKQFVGNGSEWLRKMTVLHTTKYLALIPAKYSVFVFGIFHCRIGVLLVIRTMLVVVSRPKAATESAGEFSGVLAKIM